MMDFGNAIKALKAGKRVARAGWNGKGLSIELQVPDANSKMTLPYIYMNYPSTPASDTAPASHIDAKVPWLASQTDILAEDWQMLYPSDVNPELELLGQSVTYPSDLFGQDVERDKEVDIYPME